MLKMWIWRDDYDAQVILGGVVWPKAYLNFPTSEETLQKESNLGNLYWPGIELGPAASLPLLNSGGLSSLLVHKNIKWGLHVKDALNSVLN